MTSICPPNCNCFICAIDQQILANSRSFSNSYLGINRSINLQVFVPREKSLGEIYEEYVFEQQELYTKLVHDITIEVIRQASEGDYQLSVEEAKQSIKKKFEKMLNMKWAL